MTAKWCVDCITQPLEPNDFVLLKLATEKTVKHFVGLIQEMEPDVRNSIMLNKKPHMLDIFLPTIEDTAVIDLTDNGF